MAFASDTQNLGADKTHKRSRVMISAVILAPVSPFDSLLLAHARRSVEFADEIHVYRLPEPIQDFASVRNRAVSETNGEWVLFIDSDEEVTPELATEIQEAVQKDTGVQGFLVKRDDWFLGKKLRFGETACVSLLRLAKRRTGRWVRPVHERWDVRGRIGELRNPLIHRGHTSVLSMLEKIDRYAAIEATYRQRMTPVGLSRVMVEMVVFPKVKFILNYMFRLGCLDGFPGFIFALMMSFHSFLVRAYLVERMEGRRK